MAAHSITAKDINALSGRDYPRARQGRITAAVRRLMTALAARYAAWRNYRSTLDELGALTDRQLADIGVARGEILRVARTAAYQPARW